MLAIQAVGILILANISTYWHTIPFAFFHGIAFGGMIPIRAVLVSDFFGRKQFGFINGLTQSGSMIGGLIAPIMLGYMFDETGSYVTALYIITIVICIAIPISLLLRMPHQMKD